MKTHFEITDERPESHKWWVYVHTTPDGMHYVGVSSLEKTWMRWQLSNYKTTALHEYIECYGWKNIEHTVVAYIDDEKLALLYEEALMDEFAKQGTLINKQGSGGHWRDNKKEYHRNYYEEHKDEYREYREEHKDEYREYNHEYYEEHKDEILKRASEYQKGEKAKEYRNSERGRAARRKALAKLRAKVENKIYNRVTNFNRCHPDLAIETPLEAKQRYLSEGYIPNYIKNNDL